MGLYTLSIKAMTCVIHFRIKLDKDGSVKLDGADELEFQSLDEFETFFSAGPHSILLDPIHPTQGRYVHVFKPVSRGHRY